jgi:hypothetical protein
MLRVGYGPKKNCLIVFFSTPLTVNGCFHSDPGEFIKLESHYKPADRTRKRNQRVEVEENIEQHAFQMLRPK